MRAARAAARSSAPNHINKTRRLPAREIVPAKGFAGADHVMIGRARGIEREFDLLRAELAGALDRLRKP